MFLYPRLQHFYRDAGMARHSKKKNGRPPKRDVPKKIAFPTKVGIHAGAFTAIAHDGYRLSPVRQ
jgi:hypothetical protein